MKEEEEESSRGCEAGILPVYRLERVMSALSSTQSYHHRDVNAGMCSFNNVQISMLFRKSRLEHKAAARLPKRRFGARLGKTSLGHFCNMLVLP